MNKIYQKMTLDVKNPAKSKIGGFTLIELLIVVLIIGILAAVALPKYEVAVEKARITRLLPLFRSIVQAQDRAEMAIGVRPVDDDELDISIPYVYKAKRPSGAAAFEYRLANGAVFVVYSYSIIHIVQDQGYTVDYWGRANSEAFGAMGICYPREKGNKFAERVCASLGRKTEQTSSVNTPIYAIDY